MQKKIKVCRILKIRDDTDIIKNNLIYYYNIGIKHQFIMLHLPSNELLKILNEIQKEIPELKLTLLWHDKEGKGLNPINEDYLKVLTNIAQDHGYKWIIGSDSDEFLILRNHKNIQEFIKQYDNNKIISLLFKWANYIITKENEENFYKKMIYRYDYMGWTKSIGKFDKSMYFVQGLHHIGNSKYGQVKSPLQQFHIDSKIAFYAHFPFRSKDQFVSKQKIQAEKFGGWRKKELEKNKYFFENFWDSLLKKRIWPDNLDKEKNIENNKKIYHDPINFKLMEKIND